MSVLEDPDEWMQRAAQHPQRLFLETPAGKCYTYEMLLAESGRFAAALASRGVRAGDRVAVQVEKSAQAVLLYIACLRMGAVFVPINVANTLNEVEYFLRDCRPRVAVIRPADRALVEPVGRAAGIQLDTLGLDNDGSLADLAKSSAATFAAPAFMGKAPLAAIIYTSGTTGRSKGASLTRANLASNAAALAAAWHFTAADVLLHALPLFHIHGLFVAINTVLACGASLKLLPRFEAPLVLEHLSKASVYMGVPTHYTRLLQERDLSAASTAGVRLFVSGSAPLLADTHREFVRRTGHVILERYGMTETLIITSNPYAGARLPGSVGPPLEGVAVRVIDLESGNVEPQPEAIGVLQVSGPNVFAGYWQDEAKTCDGFSADGWFKTGDVGRIDDNGYVHIVGRAKDLVISGGYNVYPKEVEAELDALQGILESAVFGVPHPDFGEGVTAVVVQRPGASLTEKAVLASIKERVAAYKAPKRIIFLDELPRNSMGKVQKNELRRHFASLYASA